MLSSPPFAVGGSSAVHPEDFRVTAFAHGLNFPNGMTPLPDRSLLVATNAPGSQGYFGNSVGQLVRLVDTNGDGIADGPPQVMADGLPREITDVRLAGNLVFVASPGEQGSGVAPTITVLQLGKLTRHLTVLGRLTFTFPQPWQHYVYALETRPAPGQPGSYDLFFNVGSQDDGDTTPTNLTTTIASSDGKFAGTLEPDSIYKVTVAPGASGHMPVFSNLTQVARGLRNAAGIAFQPGTGDLYFEDNGINGDPNGNGDPQLSADELNAIRAKYVGKGGAPDFGFAHDYIHETTGAHVGSGAVQPLTAFLPVNGSYSEGPQDIAFAPSSFPTGLNHGVFLGFYGNQGAGAANPQNPVVFDDLSTGRYFDFVGNDEPLGHPVGLTATSNAVFIADLAPTDEFAASDGGKGVVYEIYANPRNCSIAGTVFNARGKPVAGRTVFIDEDGNGALNKGDRVATTDRNGHYAFALPAGRYAVYDASAAAPTSYVVRVGNGRAAAVGGKDFNETGAVAARAARAKHGGSPASDRVWDGSNNI